MDINSLEVLVAVAQEQGFSRAAERSGLAHGALVARIMELAMARYAR